MKRLNEQKGKTSGLNKTKAFGLLQFNASTGPFKKFIYDSHGLIAFWVIGFCIAAIL